MTTKSEVDEGQEHQGREGKAGWGSRGNGTVAFNERELSEPPKADGIT